MESSHSKHTLPNLRVRAAHVDDLESLNEMMYCLHEEHHELSPVLFRPPEQIEKSIAVYIDHPECLVFVAEVDNEVVGFVSGYFGQYESPVSQPVLMGTADELYITKPMRQHGLGAKLMEKLERNFIDYGAKFMFVEVWDKNKSAVAFYRRNGFINHIHCLMKDLSSN